MFQISLNINSLPQNWLQVYEKYLINDMKA